MVRDMEATEIKNMPTKIIGALSNLGMEPQNTMIAMTKLTAPKGAFC